MNISIQETDEWISTSDYDEEIDNSVAYQQFNPNAIINPIPNTGRIRYKPLVGNILSNRTGLEENQIYDQSVNNYVSVYYQKNTTNQSFLEMYYYLKAKGIKNNKFHLLLFDKDLAGVDPYDVNLPVYMKQKIFVECQRNFWYYVREVVRVQSQGGPFVKYKLDRGNLAMNFCFTLNLNIYCEQPRQTGKTVGTEVWYSWVYNFGSRNANMIFLNKKHDDAKRNLSDVKNIIKSLPPYLRFDEPINIEGKKLKTRDTVQYLQHHINFNKIEALPMARNRTAAISLLRGRTITNCWLDEAAFFQYLEDSLQNAMPALTRAFRNCRDNGAPHGLCLTSTPGFLTDDSGQYMYDLKEKMTPFTELWYDFSLQKLTEVLNSNEKSIFVYIRTTYQQLGYSEDWLKERIREQNQKWVDIRREFLLEWATTSENCPFTQEELRNVERFTHNPIKQMYVSNYLFNIYKEITPKTKTLIGVDVAAGYSKDSSAISIVDAGTTELIADFNCNYINPVDLGQVVYDLVLNYLPNSLVTIERNGVGAGTIAKLMKSRIKNNLYFEMKDRLTEERPDGIHTKKVYSRTRVFGVDNSKDTRVNLMDLLTDRVRDHYDKFVSPILLEEMKCMEVKKSGRIEHSNNSHDDTVFSYLYALYPLYYGKNLRENWNITIPTLKTAEDEAEEIFTEFEGTETVSIVRDLEGIDNDMVQEQLEYMSKDKTKLYQDFINQQRSENEAAMANILSTKLGRQVYADKYNVTEEQLEESSGSMDYDMTHAIDQFYKENDYNVKAETKVNDW